jgi:hypothetical protein
MEELLEKHREEIVELERERDNFEKLGNEIEDALGIMGNE